jgi:nucleotide-binding universal stress UspA family protein
MFRQLLLPLDGSAFAEAALPLVRRLAAGGARVHVLHAQSPAVVTGLSAFEAQVLGEQTDRMAAYLERTVQALAPLPATAYLRTGEVGAVVGAYAAAEGIDLTVVSTHGRSGVDRAWLGSGAEAIILQSPVPVLVHHPAGDAPAPAVASPATIVVAVDRSEFSLRILPAAESLAAALGASLLLVTVVEPALVSAATIGLSGMDAGEDGTQRQVEAADAFLLEVESALRARGVAVATQVLVDAQPARAIIAEAERRGAAAIAMTTHGRRAVARMLFGSVTDKVIRGSRRDVLVLRGERSA